MKSIFSIVALASLLALTSCASSDDDSGSVLATGTIGGNITANTTFARGNYTLEGGLRVKNGATVTFESGSTITAKAADGVDFVLVENGGKLVVNGTASEPVVFTEVSKTAGSWGGIIMFGDAPIKAVGGNTTSVSEDGNALSYGGTNTTHNGGILRYVRVEYAGKKISDGTSEMNGFSFYAVGSGTILENLVSYKGADDGFEFYGGTVSAKNLISYGNSDDSFDWQDGWQGTDNSNWFAYQTGVGNYGMEIESSNNNNDFYPMISNISLIRANGTQTETAGSVEYDAIQFKKHGNGVFTNLKITGYTVTGATAVRIQDANIATQVSGGKIKILQANIASGITNHAAAGTVTYTFPSGNFTTSTTSIGATLVSGNWSVVDGSNLLSGL